MRPLTQADYQVLFAIFALTIGSYVLLAIIVEVTTYVWSFRDLLVVLAWLSGALMTFGAMVLLRPKSGADPDARLSSN